MYSTPSPPPFLSNEADIIREVRAFGLTLKRERFPSARKFGFEDAFEKRTPSFRPATGGDAPSAATARICTPALCTSSQLLEVRNATKGSTFG
jgi:hypothetical protein